ncbi:MAG: hypothetical protein IJC39_01080 [Firmicutes bacterium]|nr:hypothetical protein [Bacillota bacterium]
MSKAKPVAAYINSTKDIMRHFNCTEDIFLKPLPGCKWSISETPSFNLLSYWNGEGGRADAVMVRKNGEPLVFKTQEHTMVVAIDCVKIGFIFDNENFEAPE